MILADGMGSGLDASVQSEQLVDLLEDMLEAGFRKETAIRILNELLTVTSKGETFATLDLCMVDLYTGVGEFLKMGASATFIRRGSWIETIQSTSLPVGVQEQTEIDAIQKKFYHGDMIVMVSDGLLDGILFENKEECLKEMLLEISTNNPQELADELMERVKRMNTRGMRDDASILVLGLWRK
jgi:stage II sporulation protein E